MYRVINGFPLYEIYNDGSIRNVSTGKYLKPYLVKGYKTVSLCKDGKRYSKQIHRLVAEHFIPNPNNLPQVNHKDGDKLNCYDWNLEWCTQSENTKHACDVGLISKEHLDSARKSSNDIMSISVLQIDNDGNIVGEYSSASNAGKVTNINHHHICECCKGKRKTAGGYVWRYKN